MAKIVASKLIFDQLLLSCHSWSDLRKKTVLPHQKSKSKYRLTEEDIKTFWIYLCSNDSVDFSKLFEVLEELEEHFELSHLFKKFYQSALQLAISEADISHAQYLRDKYGTKNLTKRQYERMLLIAIMRRYFEYNLKGDKKAGGKWNKIINKISKNLCRA